MGSNNPDAWFELAGPAPRWAVESAWPEASARRGGGWPLGEAIARLARRVRVSPKAAPDATPRPTEACATPYPPMSTRLLQAWSGTARWLPAPSAPNLTAVTLYRERRAHRAAACTRMMAWPLTRLPASMVAQGNAPSPPTLGAHAADSSAAWPAERGEPAAHDIAVTHTRRAQRGHEALQAGDLDRAQAELADVDFARSEAGVALQGAVAQRAIYLGDGARAVAIFHALDAAGDVLQAAEYRQWFALLLQMRKLDDAQRLQDAHVALQVPLQQLAMAHALAEAGRESALLACLAARPPGFTREVQERQWLYLLAHVQVQRPDLLARFRVRFAANREVQRRLLSTGALVRLGQGAARHASALAAGDGFSAARAGLARRAGRFDEAQRWSARATSAPRAMHTST